MKTPSESSWVRGKTMKSGRVKMLSERLIPVSGRTQPGIRCCQVYNPEGHFPRCLCPRKGWKEGLEDARGYADFSIILMMANGTSRNMLVRGPWREYTCLCLAHSLRFSRPTPGTRPVRRGVTRPLHPESY